MTPDEQAKKIAKTITDLATSEREVYANIGVAAILLLDKHGDLSRDALVAYFRDIIDNQPAKPSLNDLLNVKVAEEAIMALTPQA